jgi:hypothetical protein
MTTVNHVSIVSVLRAEFIKYKGTLLMYMALFAPLLIVFIYFMAGVAKGTDFLDPEADVWHVYAMRIMQMGYGFFYPLHLILIGALISQVDHANDTWKHLLVQPVSRASVYWIKLLGLFGMTFVSILIFIVSIVLTGMILDFVHPEIGLGSPVDILWYIAKASGAAFLASLGILGIQYAVSIQWKSIAIPMSLGLSGFVAAVIFTQGWEYTPFFPYAYTVVIPIGLMNSPLAEIPIQIWLGPAVCAAAVMLGLVGFMRKRV